MRFLLLFFSAIFLLFSSCGNPPAPKLDGPAPMKYFYADGKPFYPSPQQHHDLQFDFLSHEFGEIKYGSEVRKVYTCVNTGEKPVRIMDAVKSCACIHVDFPKEPIAPGKTGVVVITLKTTEDTPITVPRTYEKIISLIQEGEEVPIALKLNGKVNP